MSLTTVWKRAAAQAWSPDLVDHTQLLYSLLIPDAGGEHEALEAILSNPNNILNQEFICWSNIHDACSDYIEFSKAPERQTNYRLLYYVCCLHIGMFVGGEDWMVESIAAAMAGALWAGVKAEQSDWLCALVGALDEWPDAFGHPDWDVFPRLIAAAAREFAFGRDGRPLPTMESLSVAVREFVTVRAEEMILDLLDVAKIRASSQEPGS